ncbi:hypothetical protein QQ045_025621 [Rhodiola kirilowii]
MAKAYDRVSWRFILAALRAYGFHERFCDLIYRCISNCHYSIKWDGKLYGYFKSFRGVRQGDPLSPTLFVLAMEWLSKSLNDAVKRGDIWRYYTCPRAIAVNHLLFADDLLLFTSGAKQSIRSLSAIIQAFCHISGQRLNPNKSTIIFSKIINNIHHQSLLNLTGFAAGHLRL